MERQNDGHYEQTDRQIREVANELGLGGFVEKLRDLRNQLMLQENRQMRLLQRLARLEQQNENPGRLNRPRRQAARPGNSGLTPERVERFQHFNAGESKVGERCPVCLGDLQVDTILVRLDCHVDHYLCRSCAIGWFRDNSTCPLCRHAF